MKLPIGYFPYVYFDNTSYVQHTSHNTIKEKTSSKTQLNLIIGLLTQTNWVHYVILEKRDIENYEMVEFFFKPDWRTF